jgi:glycine/D-amino acid oxidase-like deaminating enzyme
MSDYRQLSLWFDQLGGVTPRPALTESQDADIAIVGAGYTGLWTAYYLLQANPSLRIAIVEAEVAGFGASGRNGGWCSALFPVSLPTLARESGRDRAIAQYAAMQASVGEVARVTAAEGIDADLALGGTIVLARSTAQIERARAEAEELTSFGFDLDLVGASLARERLNATALRRDSTGEAGARSRRHRHRAWRSVVRANSCALDRTA